MQVRTNALVIEVTRRCNMCCEHCLRGEAQNLDITHEILEHIAKTIAPCEVTFTGGEPTLNVGAIRDYFDLAKKYETLPLAFYVITNGKTDAALQKELALTLLEAYADMAEPETCGVAVSHDIYHDSDGTDNTNVLHGLSFYRPDDKTYPNSFDHWIDSGRAKKNGIGVQYPGAISDSLEELFEDAIYDDAAECELLYVAANGNVVDNCDHSYEDVDAQSLCHISELSDKLDAIVASELTSKTCLTGKENNMEKKTKTIDDFKQAFIAEPPITARGRGTDLNTSSILTRLIQEAGRWCKSYASDLLIDWISVDEAIRNNGLESGSHLFGFRENGVDGERFILSRYNGNSPAPSLEYRAIWRLDITVDNDTEDGRQDIEMALYEVAR